MRISQIVQYLHQTPENWEIGEKWGKTQFFPKHLTLTLKTLDPPVRNSWHLRTGGSRVMEPSVKSFGHKCQVFQERMRWAWKGRSIRMRCFVRTFWLEYKILHRYASQRDKQKGESFVHGFTLAMTSLNRFYRAISEQDCSTVKVAPMSCFLGL